MADPLAQAFADLPESSESEGEQSDAQSSEEEEELDSEEEAVKKLVRAHVCIVERQQPGRCNHLQLQRWLRRPRRPRAAG